MHQTAYFLAIPYCPPPKSSLCLAGLSVEPWQNWQAGYPEQCFANLL
jgi:hypothetical protein